MITKYNPGQKIYIPVAVSSVSIDSLGTHYTLSHTYNYFISGNYIHADEHNMKDVITKDASGNYIHADEHNMIDVIVTEEERSNTEGGAK